ncbi:MAG: hypothetical protein AAF845_01055 [Bacteroidota bacterium]
MGKGIIIAVAGLSLVAVTALSDLYENDQRSTERQIEHNEEELAAQIARSAYNVAFAMVNEAPTIEQGVANVNAGGGLAGELYGGTYTATAHVGGGSSFSITANGYFGDAASELKDAYAEGTTTVTQSGYLRVRYLESRAGYCSSLYLQRVLPGVSEANQPAPEMIFAPGKNRDGRATEKQYYLEAGTFMNFFIGVDKNCSQRDVWVDDYPSYIANDPRAYDYLHWAFDQPDDLDFSTLKEAPYAMIEDHPSIDQHWRVSFEDINRWNAPDDTRPRKSLQATRDFGYDMDGDGVGDGWPDNERYDIQYRANGTIQSVRVVSGSDGYNDLRNYGDRPDFSDQVVEIWIEPGARNDDQIAQQDLGD